MMVCRKSMILGQSCLALGLLLLLSVDAGQAPVVPDITGTDATGTNGMGGYTVSSPWPLLPAMLSAARAYCWKVIY